MKNKKTISIFTLGIILLLSSFDTFSQKLLISRDGYGEYDFGSNSIDGGSLNLAENTASSRRRASISFHNGGIAEGILELASDGPRRLKIFDHQGQGMGLQMSGQLDVSNSFLTNPGEILLRPQDGNVEGGQLTFISSNYNSSKNFYLDNYAGTMRFVTGAGTKVGMSLDQNGSFDVSNSFATSTGGISIKPQDNNSEGGQLNFIAPNNDGSKYFYIDNYAGNMRFVTAGGSKIGMLMAQNGNVSIGTNSNDYKLNVCGTIRAAEVRVETGWCDFVFEDKYKLMPLTEVETFIKANKHLPGINPAKEVETEGLKVGEMSSKMILKIEELTLYMIELNKTVNELKSENKILKQAIETNKSEKK